MSSVPTVLVDADGLPRDARELLVRAAGRTGWNVVLVSNRWVEKPRVANVSVVQVPAGPDVADDWIVEHAKPGDLVVSDDVPLAARAVERGAEVLQFRGRLLDASNVGEVLSVRNFGADLREMGVETGGPSGWGAKEKQAFANGLDRWITRARSRNPVAPT
jgi:uncharacterized protein YaiI (UPF0178 family)